MLEHLFGSKTRVKLLRMFLGNPGTAFYVRELVRKAGAQIHAIRRELENLERLGIIRAGTANESDAAEVSQLRARMRRYYQLDEEFFLTNELRALVLRSQFLLEEEFKRRVKRLGTIHYFALLGMFVGATDATTDAVIVGKLNRPLLARLMRQFERDLGRPMNYTVMSEREFRYRWDVGDRFLYGILEGKKIVVIDELTPAAKAAASATMV
ncbi:hypothetical protein HY634_01685 [Candidatus Uhrbacteria bacterium]|nr:hypothetical protein [Candidatus Uhrbacteria bacterium]